MCLLLPACLPGSCPLTAERLTDIQGGWRSFRTGRGKGVKFRLSGRSLAVDPLQSFLVATSKLSLSGPGSHTEEGLVSGHECGRTEQTDSRSVDLLPEGDGITHLICKPAVLVRSMQTCLLSTPVFSSRWTKLVGISALASPLPPS